MNKITNIYDKKNNIDILIKWIENNLEHEFIGDLFEIVDIINGNDYDENVIWHYTKMNVLEKILQQNEVQIRFTNTNDSDDPLETRVYKPFLIKNKEKILNNLNNLVEFKLYESVKKDFMELIENKENTKKRITTCTFSMSRLKDSYAFWSKEYAGLDGIAIGFNKNVLKEIFSEGMIYDVFYIEPDKDINLVDDAIIRMFSVLIMRFYNLYTKNPKYLDYISSENFTILSHISDVLSGIVKHKSWKYERETRIVLADRRITKLTFHKEFVGGKKRFYYQNLDKSVISSVMLAPTCNEEQEKEVERYLKDNGYNIPVTRSRAFDLKYSDFKG